LSPQQASERIEAVITKATEALNKVIERAQFNAYNAILKRLKDLELDNDGYIKQNNTNRKIIRDIGKDFDRSLNASGYTKGLNDFVASMESIDAVNIAYFAAIDDSAIANALFIKDLQRQTIASVENMLLDSGLESQVKQPLLNILNQNVNTGGSYSGMVQQVKDYVVGTDDADGKLLRYSKQITQDALNNYSRAYQNAVGNSLGLVFYQYVGGLMKDSREFCRDRVNGYFHYLEIESWAKLEWKGKNPLTTKSSIFVVLAGFNCIHQVLPVSSSAVPSDWINRAVDLGFYKG